jgi:hypothetical protein
MTSLPATPPPALAPDRLFGPFDRELAHRTSLPPAKAPQVFSLPLAARDAAPSYCGWPAALLRRS